jgi:squalene-associated FAD-dependent desaturase
MIERAAQKSTVAVVGGGLAGLSAGCALADLGFRVTLFERRSYLGGRASSYQHPGTGETVDNCQHVLFGSCTNLIDFYRRIGVLDEISWFDEMTFVEPGGRQTVLRPTLLPAPLQTAPSFLNFPFLSGRDKLLIARALTAILSIRDDNGSESFADWLSRHQQSDNCVQRFWKPVLVSALSEYLDHISVSYAAQVIRESLRSTVARRMGIPRIPLTQLYRAAEDYMLARDGQLQLRSSVESFVPEADATTVRVPDGSAKFDFVVIAVPYFALASLLPVDAKSQSLRDSLANFESSPITGIHLWFDREITNLPHAVLLDRTIQWMFHKSKLLRGTAEKQGECLTDDQRDAEAVSGGSYVELVVSASKTLVEKSKAEIAELALRELREFFPDAREASLLKSTVIKEVHATYSPRPGIDAYRPSQKTVWPRVFLAGDWTATGWPATMEGAVRSGYMAAECLARAAGLSDVRFLVADLPATGLMRLFG